LHSMAPLRDVCHALIYGPMGPMGLWQLGFL
jgi:hypothetical protein